MRIRRTGRLRGWLELVRPPNLLTVPGDPLAGFALASLGRVKADWLAVLPIAAAAMLIYAAGLIWNDCADLREDRCCRPQRPLPSGRVNPRSAGLVAAVLALCGIGLAATGGLTSLVGSVILVLLVILYDLGPCRRVRWLGALNMGACRGVSLLMGASVSWPVSDGPVVVPVAAAGVTLFIAAVTWIADRETEAVRIGPVRWAPGLIVAMTYAILLSGVRQCMPVANFCALLSVVWLLQWGRKLQDEPAPERVGRSIGGMIRAILPLQAAFCAFGTGDAVVVVALLVAWPVSALLGQRFYAS